MNALPELLRSEIACTGALSFRRFMELALYCPDLGYYARQSRTIGRRGDFFTSVSVGGLFGELCALQFAEWLAVLPLPSLQIVEAGAHDGQLAADVLGALHHFHPALARQIHYCIVEPLPARRAEQSAKLAPFAGQVRWCESLDELGERRVHGIFFSNELLDALPVHRLGWDAGRRQWSEWGVAVQGSRFVWTRLPWQLPASDAAKEIAPLLSVPDELARILPDGFTIELALPALEWWTRAARSLSMGWLLTFDYGFDDASLLRPESPQGTLRGFRRHRFVDDLLADPGDQDLTAHVAFHPLRLAGEANGLETAALWPQARFFHRVVERLERKPDLKFDWTAARRRQFQTLAHPEHLGQAFRVFVQHTNSVAGL